MNLGQVVARLPNAAASAHNQTRDGFAGSTRHRALNALSFQPSPSKIMERQIAGSRSASSYDLVDPIVAVSHG